MTHALPLHELAGLIPVRSATTALPHYAETEGAQAVCTRQTGERMSDSEAAAAPRFCSHCVAHAEQLAAERTEPASPLITAARAFADSIEPGDRNTEIRALARRADVDLAHGTNGFEPHYADPMAVITLCSEPIDRRLTEEQGDRASVLCKACETAARQIASAREAEEVAARTPITDPRVHSFGDTREAYDASMCDSEIRDGDVLVIASEKVVGFLNKAWPVALTVGHGELHTLNVPVGELDEGRYAASARLAAEEARKLDVALRDDHAPARGCAPRHSGNPDVGAALGVLNGLASATLTDEHDITEPSDTDLPVRGYTVEPHGHGLVAAYWLERGLARRQDDGWHGPALEALADRFIAAGWAVEPLRPSSLCVFAHRPQPATPEAANH